MQPFLYVQLPVNSRKVYDLRGHDLSWTPVQRKTRSSLNNSKSKRVQGGVTAPEVRDIELFFFLIMVPCFLQRETTICNIFFQITHSFVMEYCPFKDVIISRTSSNIYSGSCNSLSNLLFLVTPSKLFFKISDVMPKILQRVMLRIEEFLILTENTRNLFLLKVVISCD